VNITTTITGMNPFRASANIATTNQAHDPVVRRTFMAPTLPVPCWVISSPVTPFAMM
jgi:hypothetical protein